MKIINQKQGNFSKKDNGTEVNFFAFQESEIHYNKLPHGSTQTWHHHLILEEIVCVTSGQMEVLWREDQKDFSAAVKAGDVIRVENTPHTFTNNSGNDCNFIVFRFVPNGKNQTEIFTNDKYRD